MPFEPVIFSFSNSSEKIMNHMKGAMRFTVRSVIVWMVRWLKDAGFCYEFL